MQEEWLSLSFVTSILANSDIDALPRNFITTLISQHYLCSLDAQLSLAFILILICSFTKTPSSSKVAKNFPVFSQEQSPA
jgi:hypothetical protein